MENLPDNMVSRRLDDMSLYLKKINNKLKFFVILTIIMLIPTIVSLILIITAITSLGIGELL